MVGTLWECCTVTVLSMNLIIKHYYYVLGVTTLWALMMGEWIWGWLTSVMLTRHYRYVRYARRVENCIAFLFILHRQYYWCAVTLRSLIAVLLADLYSRDVTQPEIIIIVCKQTNRWAWPTVTYRRIWFIQMHAKRGKTTKTDTHYTLEHCHILFWKGLNRESIFIADDYVPVYYAGLYSTASDRLLLEMVYHSIQQYIAILAD